MEGGNITVRPPETEPEELRELMDGREDKVPRPLAAEDLPIKGASSKKKKRKAPAKLPSATSMPARQTPVPPTPGPQQPDLQPPGKPTAAKAEPARASARERRSPSRYSN